MFRTARSLLLGGLTGKLVGIVRELLSASLLGTGPVITGFRLAQATFSIPLQTLLSDVLASGFTPNYARQLRGQPLAANELFAAMHRAAALASLAVAALVGALAHPAVHLLAPGVSDETAALATRMVRVMALAMPLFALTSVYASAEMAAGRPGIASARASVQSIGIVVGLIAAVVTGIPELLPWGLVAAYVGLTAFGIRAVRARGMLLWPRRPPRRDASGPLRAVWSAYRWLIAVPLLLQVNYFFERRVASVLNPHAIASLEYARFVADTAVLLVAMPFGVAALSDLAAVSEEQFRSSARRAFRLLLFVGAPVSVTVAVHARWLVEVLYARGAFDASSVANTSTILQASAAGLWAQLMSYAGIKFLSARNRNRTVAWAYAASIVTNIVINLTLGRVVGVGVLGISSSIAGAILALAIVTELDLFRELSSDLILGAAAAIGYVALVAVLPESLMSEWWGVPLVAVSYWVMVAVAVPRYRSVAVSSWRALHANTL